MSLSFSLSKLPPGFHVLPTFLQMPVSVFLRLKEGFSVLLLVRQFAKSCMFLRSSTPTAWYQACSSGGLLFYAGILDVSTDNAPPCAITHACGCESLSMSGEKKKGNWKRNGVRRKERGIGREELGRDGRWKGWWMEANSRSQ